MKHTITFLLAACLCLSGCAQLQEDQQTVPDDLITNSPENNAIRSYDYGTLPLVPHNPYNQYLPFGLEVSVNTIGKKGGVIEVIAGYPKEEGRVMKDWFLTSWGEAVSLPADHFSVTRRPIDSSHVLYAVEAAENKTEQELVFYVDIYDFGSSSDGKGYFNRALIIVEQLSE